jgi:hypothetical protein
MQKGMDELPTTLFNIGAKLKGLGELIMFQQRNPSADEADVVFGMGLVIRNLGEELAALSSKLDVLDVKQGKKK